MLTGTIHKNYPKNKIHVKTTGYRGIIRLVGGQGGIATCVGVRIRIQTDPPSPSRTCLFCYIRRRRGTGRLPVSKDTCVQKLKAGLAPALLSCAFTGLGRAFAASALFFVFQSADSGACVPCIPGMPVQAGGSAIRKIKRKEFYGTKNTKIKNYPSGRP